MILVTGATGFIGGEILRRASRRGWRTRGLARHPHEAGALGRLPHVELHRGDILEPGDLDEAMEEVSTVIHLVGIIAPSSTQGFEAVHVQGTGNVVAAAERAGVGRYVHMSALGVERGREKAAYFRTKWEAEETVRASGLESTIFRPSIVFGLGHERFERIVRAVRWSPVVPLPGGGDQRVQPVWVGDVAECFLQAARAPETREPTYEVAGPREMTLRGLVETLARMMGKTRRVVTLPEVAARLGAGMIERVLPDPPVTRDQLAMLEVPNVADAESLKALLRDFEIEHASIESRANEILGE